MTDISPITIHVIIGSTRENRFSEKPAQWIFDELKKRDGINAELVDLRDFPLPFFDAPKSPIWTNKIYPHQIVTQWSEKVSEADAYIMVAPEYNHGYSAVLKNALDWLYPEWNHKAVGFVSYGGVGGARAVEQLRQVAVELQMLPIRNGLHIPIDAYLAAMNEPAPVNPEIFNKPLRIFGDAVAGFLDQLIAMTNASKALRQ